VAPPNLQDNEDRWYSMSPYQGLTQQNLQLLQNPSATGEGGTCFGDSGGAHFWQDTLIIVSVTSWGDAICRSNDMTQRIDLASVLDWLAEFGVTPARPSRIRLDRLLRTRRRNNGARRPGPDSVVMAWLSLAAAGKVAAGKHSYAHDGGADRSRARLE